MNVAVRRRHLGSSYIELTATTKKNVVIEFEVNGCKKVDWGDGVHEKNSTINTTSTLTHEYNTDKVRTLKFYGDLIVFVYKETKALTISSIKFIGVKSINYLRLSGSKIPSIDISNLTELKKLFLADCLLTEMNLSNNTKLDSVYLQGNRLTSIDVTNLPDLEILSIYSNRIGPTVNIHNNKKLKTLWIQRMQSMKSIDLSENSLISNLAMTDSGYQGTVDLSNLTELVVFQAYGCTEIDNFILGENVVYNRMVKFAISDSNVSEIDLSKMTNLTSFSSWNCKNIVNLDFSQTPKIEEIIITNCSLPTINVGSCTKLKSLRISGNPLTDFIIPNNVETLIVGKQDNLQMTDFDVSNFEKLRRFDFGAKETRVSLPFLVNKRSINPRSDYESDFVLCLGKFIYDKDVAAISENDIPMAVRYIAEKVKELSLYQYPQMFLIGRKLTVQETRDLYEEVKTIFYNTIILCGQESAANIFPSSQFEVSFLSGQLYEYKESFSVKCKADAEFFIYPQSNGSLRFDKMSRVLYEKGTIKTKGGAKAIKKQTLPNNEIELEVALEVTDKRNYWRIGIFENKYQSESDQYVSKVIGVQRKEQ